MKPSSSWLKFCRTLRGHLYVHITIAANKFRPPFSCHFTKIACSLTFIAIMIDVCKLKFEIYYCDP
jgi:hypothetical protein